MEDSIHIIHACLRLTQPVDSATLFTTKLREKVVMCDVVLTCSVPPHIVSHEGNVLAASRPWPQLFSGFHFIMGVYFISLLLMLRDCSQLMGIYKCLINATWRWPLFGQSHPSTNPVGFVVWKDTFSRISSPIKVSRVCMNLSTL